MRGTFVLPLFAAAACAAPAPIDTDPLPAGDQAVAGVAAGVPIVWSAQFTGSEGWESLRGSVRVASTADSTAARASVSGAPSGTTLSWRVREGECAEGGPIVGNPAAYPPLQTGSEGTAVAEARLAPTLRAMTYSAELRSGQAEAGPLVACTNLVQSL